MERGKHKQRMPRTLGPSEHLQRFLRRTGQVNSSIPAQWGTETELSLSSMLVLLAEKSLKEPAKGHR